MTSNKPLLLLPVTCLVLATCSILASAYLPHPEAQRLCRLRTGLGDRDIVRYNTRNEDCAVDCITRQGTLMTAYVEDGSICHDDHSCQLGKCRVSGEKPSEELTSDLYLANIHIKSAFVADRDPYPAQGESDAFVVVEVDSEGLPAFREREVICHTHVVQDTSRPHWNFACKSLPLKGSAKLKFTILDSDKPDTDPQLLGSVVQSVDSLLNGGVQRLNLSKPVNVPGGPYWLEVELNGKRYE